MKKRDVLKKKTKRLNAIRKNRAVFSISVKKSFDQDKEIVPFIASKNMHFQIYSRDKKNVISEVSTLSLKIKGNKRSKKMAVLMADEVYKKCLFLKVDKIPLLNTSLRYIKNSVIDVFYSELCAKYK